MLTRSVVDDAYCQGVNFQVTDVPRLAAALAYVLVQEFSLARRLAVDSAVVAAQPQLEQRHVDDIITRRLRPKDKYHRDGLLFQLIMWLASHLDTEDGDLVALPHSQGSAKGQDSIIVHRSAGAVIGVTICEDKATENPRDTITSKVWKEIRAYELGGRHDEIRSSIIATLGTGGIAQEEAENLIRRISWEGKRRYRVRVTVEGSRSAILFEGFNTTVSGSNEMRRGEATLLPGLRAWMDDLTVAVEDALRASVLGTSNV